MLENKLRKVNLYLALEIPSLIFVFHVVFSLYIMAPGFLILLFYEVFVFGNERFQKLERGGRGTEGGRVGEWERGETVYIIFWVIRKILNHCAEVVQTFL